MGLPGNKSSLRCFTLINTMQPEVGIFSSECDGTFLRGKARKVGQDQCSSKELLLSTASARWDMIQRRFAGIWSDTAIF